jgi:methylated-DNA-protein-cysteine methyltransferase-like protein
MARVVRRASRKASEPHSTNGRVARTTHLGEDSQARRIYAVVAAIPRGKVATYGQLAMLAGIHAGHRVAARAMQQCPNGLAWYRVLAKKDARRAKIAIADPDGAALQRRRLAAEGVTFDESGHIVLRHFGWLPAEAPSQKRQKPVASAARKRKSR